MSQIDQLHVGAIVRVGNTLTIVSAKLEDTFGLVPTVYLLAEVEGHRCFKVIAGVGAFQIDQAEADDILARVEVRAWRDAGVAIARARVRARVTCAGTRPAR
ncbi:MAG: hypothetical protein M0Z99_31015 [Betaproteobacteria bacterium]|nr:hypothetical protein [Betaproteobacteria bacterium]